MKRVTGADGTCVDLPLGEYCWPCAVSLECWPLVDKEASAEKYKKEGEHAFCEQVQLIREGVVAAKAQIEMEKVTALKNTEVSCRMIRRYKFVFSNTFAKYFGLPLDLVSDMAVTMLTVDYDYAEGVLIRGSLPDDLEYDEVEVSSGTSRIRQEELAGPGTVFRKGQAGERFQRAANAHVQGRPLGMKSSSRRPMTFEQIKVKVMEEDKRRQELEAEMVAQHSVAGAQSEHVSGSRLDDEDEMTAAAQHGRKTAAAPRAKGRVASRGPAMSKAPGTPAPRAKASPGTPAPRSARAPGTPAPRWAALRVASVPVLGAAATPGLLAAPAAAAAPSTPAFAVAVASASAQAQAQGQQAAAATPAGVDFSIDADGDVPAGPPQTIDDMMNLPKVLIGEEHVDRQNLRKAMRKSLCYC